jgi:hypothetical protein
VSNKQAADPMRELEAEVDRWRETWGAWLRTLSTFEAETDLARANELATEVARGMPFAVNSRLAYLRLLPLDMRRRELEATSARFKFAVELAALTDAVEAHAAAGVPPAKGVEER